MEETAGLLNQIRHHDKLPITLNENCAIPLPDDILRRLLKPHRLSFYYLVFMDQGEDTYTADLKDITISDGQLVFGLPNQIFANPLKHNKNKNYKLGFDENTLALLPRAYPFLVNPFGSNMIRFNAAAKQRVKSTFSILFQLLHSPGKQQNTEIILAHLNALLTELNTAYFENHDREPNITDPKLSRYIAFKLAVENELTEQHDVHSIAEKLSMTTSSLYSVVKEFSGISPKEWMTNRLIQEAQRKLQYSTLSVKEVAYALGFNDPDYFSRLFRKSTGKSVRAYVAESRDLAAPRDLSGK